MADWYPLAKRTLLFPGVGAFVTGAPKRGVLHTTEGSTLTGALATYAVSKSYPHFTLDDTTVEQHCPISVTATALQNAAGGVETNRYGAIQIELVLKAANAGQMSAKQKNLLASLMRWLEINAGIKPVAAPVWKAYPASYGRVNGVRFPNAYWLAFNGWCGHQHVPENDHGDPGLLPIAELLPPKEPAMANVPNEPWRVDVLSDTAMGAGLRKKLCRMNFVDSNGRAYYDTNVPIDKFVSCNVRGPAPARDGYDWANVYWSHNDTGNQATVEFENGSPWQVLVFEIVYVG